MSEENAVLRWHEGKRLYSFSEFNENRGRFGRFSDHFADWQWEGNGFKVKEDETPDCYVETEKGIIGMYHGEQVERRQVKAVEAPELAIWWIDGVTNSLILGFDGGEKLPEYIRNQLEYMQGRPLRGRLWVTKGIELEEIAWPKDNVLAKAAEFCGGIVFYRRDLERVRQYPGFITDTNFKGL